MQDLIWLIPALPLAGFALLVFAGRRLGEPLAGWIATAAVGGSFLATVGVFASLVGRSHEERAFTQTVFEWLPVGGLHVDMGFLADPLSVTMCLFVTGIATLIHLYSIGYMHGVGGRGRLLVLPHLVLARERGQRVGRQEGLRHQPHR